MLFILEGTLASFNQAELHKTKDDSLVVIHDLSVDRTRSNNKKGKSTCNPEMVEKLNEYLVYDEEPDEDEPVDERWSELKKLLDNK